MAHYAYKRVMFDIDYEHVQELIVRFEKEQECAWEGDSNYDGDNWYIAAMWINELREKVAELEAQLAAQGERNV